MQTLTFLRGTNSIQSLKNDIKIWKKWENQRICTSLKSIASKFKLETFKPIEINESMDPILMKYIN